MLVIRPWHVKVLRWPMSSSKTNAQRTQWRRSAWICIIRKSWQALMKRKCILSDRRIIHQYSLARLMREAETRSRTEPVACYTVNHNVKWRRWLVWFILPSTTSQRHRSRGRRVFREPRNLSQIHLKISCSCATNFRVNAHCLATKTRACIWGKQDLGGFRGEQQDVIVPSKVAFCFV